MPETFLHGVELLEVDTGSRPIQTVRSSVIGLVGSGIDNSVPASVEIGAGNSKVKFIQTDGLGAVGNTYSVAIIKPSGNNVALSVSRVGKNVTISLATDAASVATTTAAQLITFFNGVGGAVANSFLFVSLGIGSSGVGLVAPATQTLLTSGVDGSFPLNTPVLVTSPRDIDTKFGATSYLGKSLEAIYKQAGAVVVVVRINSQAADNDATSLTGIYALKRAQAVVGYTPRIIVSEAAAANISDVKSVCASLRATTFIGLTIADFAAATDATAWVSANGNDRTMAIWPSVNGGEDPAPLAAGLLAKSDNERGFWWSPSNREVFGINLLDAPVDFQLGDTTSLANVLNEGKVTTFIRQGGFRLWGNLTGSIDKKYQFLSVRRTADIINDSILVNHLWAVDRNITKTYLQDVSGGVSDYLATLINQGAILGGTCWPDPDLNSPDQIALGKVYFNFDFTPPYPAQTVTFRSILTNDYLSELI